MNLCSKLISEFYTKNLLSSSSSSTSSALLFSSLPQITNINVINHNYWWNNNTFVIINSKFSTLCHMNNNNNNNKNNNAKIFDCHKKTNYNMMMINSIKNTSCLYSKFTVRDPHHTVIPQGLAESVPLNDDRAYEILLSLSENELKAVKNALERYEATKIKEHFEGQLAATRWRSRFGRPAKMPALGDVDPTGSYCAVPADWLKKKFVERTKPPESKDLWRIFFVNAVPFIGFGFLDNFTMIIAGDYIEYAFGTFMCISTMAAAGLGNTISDILGIGSAYYVERLSEMFGLRPPELTPIQLEMKSSRRSANSGRIFGITLGCLIGMFPLLFMDSSSKKQSSEQKE